MTMAHHPDSANIAAQYDQFTDLYTSFLGDSLHVGYWHNATDDSPIETAAAHMTDLVADQLGASAGHRLMDIGCGSGAPAIQIATSRGVHVTGITVSDHQVELAQARPHVGPEPGNADFRVADAMKLPFPNAVFDGAYAVTRPHLGQRRRAQAHQTGTPSRSKVRHR